MRDQFVFAAAQLPEDDTEDDPILKNQLMQQDWKPFEVHVRKSKRTLYLTHSELDTLFNVRGHEMKKEMHTFHPLGDSQMKTVNYCILYNGPVHVAWVIELPPTELPSTKGALLRINLEPKPGSAVLEFNGVTKLLTAKPYIALSFKEIVSLIKQDMQDRIQRSTSLGMDVALADELFVKELADELSEQEVRANEKARQRDSVEEYLQRHTSPPLNSLASNTGGAAVHPVSPQDAIAQQQASFRELSHPPSANN